MKALLKANSVYTGLAAISIEYGRAASGQSAKWNTPVVNARAADGFAAIYLQPYPRNLADSPAASGFCLSVAAFNKMRAC